MKKIIISTVVATTLALAGSNTTNKYEISPMIGQADTHDEHKLSNDTSYGLTGALRTDADNNIFDQIELGYFGTNETNYGDVNKNTAVHRLLLSGVKEYQVLDNTKLYALAGVGYEKISEKFDGIDSAAVFNYGVGVKYAINDTVSLKAEVRDVARNVNNHTVLYHAGIMFPFGNEEVMKAPEAKKMDMKKIEKTAGVDLNTAVIAHYDIDKAFIRSDDMARIKAYVNYLKKFPSSHIVVSGHTDSSASEKHNESLAARRAITFKNAIVDLGIDSKRIKVESYGETSPIASNSTKAGMQLNRRVESRIIRSMK